MDNLIENQRNQDKLLKLFEKKYSKEARRTFNLRNRIKNLKTILGSFARENEKLKSDFGDLLKKNLEKSDEISEISEKLEKQLKLENRSNEKIEIVQENLKEAILMVDLLLKGDFEWKSKESEKRFEKIVFDIKNNKDLDFVFSNKMFNFKSKNKD